MGQALYRSHRPKRLSEVVGQELVTTALKHALEKGTVSHAYLFTGPRGTGKTTIARILAHEINGLPYDENGPMLLDIIEIDAASNRRIDEIRDLRDKVNLAPATAKFKVYIIDEVHMLTREAFNALLKTLEEPPAHVVFILATTEAHKLPETIISRTQHFTFRPYRQSEVVAHLRKIAEQEKISVADDALALIAEHGEGTFRDSISLLDQLRNQAEKITLADVQACLGVAPDEAVRKLLGAVQKHDVADIATQLKALYGQGYEPAQLARQIGQSLREALIQREEGIAPNTALHLLSALVDVPASSSPRAALEIAMLDVAFADTEVAKTPKVMSESVQIKPVSITAQHPSTFKKEMPGPKTPATPPVEKQEVVPSSPTQTNDEERADEPTSGDTLDPAAWAQVLSAIKTQYNTLYGIVSSAVPSFTPGVVTLTSKFAFHQKRLHEQKNRDLIANTIEAVSGFKLRIECVVGDVSQKPTPQDATALPPLPPETGETVHVVGAAAAPAVDVVSTVSNIFGGAELLQS